MKGFNKIWHLLLSSPRVSVGDPLLSKKENDRFPNPAGRLTLGMTMNTGSETTDSQALRAASHSEMTTL